jgi:hypothetical protein
MARAQRPTELKLSEAAKKIITLAGRIRSYYDTELPKRYPQYPIIQIGEEGPPPPPDEKALRKFMTELPADLIYQLVLVMYIGRGDFGVEDLAGSYGYMKEKFADPKWAAWQMMEKTPLADYLSDGLALLEEHAIDVDKLPVENQERANT